MGHEQRVGPFPLMHSTSNSSAQLTKKRPFELSGDSLIVLSSRERRPAAPEEPQQPEKTREERIAEMQALLAEEEENMECVASPLASGPVPENVLSLWLETHRPASERAGGSPLCRLAKCTCFRLKCMRTKMFRAAASTLAVFFIFVVVLSAGLIQQALEPPLPVGDDGFPHVTMLVTSGWGRLQDADATRLVVQLGVARDKLGAGLVLAAGDALLPAPPPGAGNSSVTPAVFKAAFSQARERRERGTRALHPLQNKHSGVVADGYPLLLLRKSSLPFSPTRFSGVCQQPPLRHPLARLPRCAAAPARARARAAADTPCHWRMRARPCCASALPHLPFPLSPFPSLSLQATRTTCGTRPPCSTRPCPRPTPAGRRRP